MGELVAIWKIDMVGVMWLTLGDDSVDPIR